MNLSVGTALEIFKYVAAASFLLNLLVLYGGGADLPTAIVNTARRLVEWSFLSMVIASTWRAPFGAPGWFPAIVGGLVNIGIQIAGAIAPGAPMPSQEQTTLDGLAAYPGTIADFGAALYGNIVASIPPGNPLSQIPILGVPVAIYSLCIHALFWLVAVYAYLNCLFVAIRYFMVYMRCITVGFLTFLQGGVASQRLSGFSSGMYTAPIVVGAEFCTTIILIGVAFLFVGQLASQYNLCAGFAGGACGTLSGNPLATLGDLVELGVVVTAWSYTVHRVPTLVADAIAGRISVSSAEVRQAFSSSPMPGAKALGYSADIVAGGATGGALGAAKTAFSPIGNAARNVGVGAVAGAAGGALKGAVGGLLLGGPEGALAGAAVGAVKGVASGGKQKKSSDGAGDTSTAETPAGESQGQKRTERDAEHANEGAPARESQGGTAFSAQSFARSQANRNTTGTSAAPGGTATGTGTNAPGTPGATVATPAAQAPTSTVPGSQPTKSPISGGAPPNLAPSHTATDANEGTGADSHPGGTAFSGATAQHATARAKGGTSDAGSDDAPPASNKTVTSTTTVKQQVNSEGSGDIAKALQNLTAALNANTSAMQGGGGNAGSAGAASTGGPSGNGNGGSSGGGTRNMASELGLDMPLGGMLARQALYRQARQPIPPPPLNEESAAIGGIMTGIGR